MKLSNINKKIEEINEKVSNGSITKTKGEFLIKIMKEKLNSKIVEK